MKQDRREFLETLGLGVSAVTAPSLAQTREPPTVQSVDTAVLSVAYESSGDERGFPVILLHGFPDDARAWDEVIPPLVRAGHRTLTPYLRGYGPTRFRDPHAPRMAQQSAIGQDLIDFANALGLDRFAVAGYDWGNRAGCIAAALHPERVRAAVFIGGYSIQNTIAASRPASPQTERALWYQWYFNTERGRAGLALNRRPLCRLLWETWSPTWRFSDETYERTATSFDNPDFVDIVIHSYRHRHGNTPGESRFAATEQRLAERPRITVPTITLHGADDGLGRPPADSSGERAQFASLVARRVVPGAGHFMPRERPDAVSAALLELLATTR